MESRLRNLSESDDAKIRSTVKVPTFLKNSRPLANSRSFLHVISVKPDYPLPDFDRRFFFHALMTSNYEYGILTRHKIPEICEFPTYTDLGKTRIKIRCNTKTFLLDENQIDDITKFHKFLFLNILKVVPECFVYSENKDDFFIVPLKPGSNDGGMCLAWKVIKEKVQFKNACPSDTERRTGKYLEENYLGRVITPWYTKEPTHFIVTAVETGMSLNSSMMGLRKTFATYYKEKYDLTALNKTQALLEARPVTNILECIKLRAITASEKNKRRTKKDNIMYLVPEFCNKQIFPAVFWYKSIILPSVLHRMFHLLLAEDLRQKIVREASIGSLRTVHENESNYFIENDINAAGDTNNTSATNHMSSVPSLQTLQNYPVNYGGPNQYQILQALTLRSADDSINLERLETLGDSFLKYAVSLAIFIQETNKDEGSLSILKGQIVGNKNLFCCAKKLGISGYIKALRFNAKEGWYPPGFSVPEFLKDRLLDIFPPSALKFIKIPPNEQSSGKISLPTFENIRIDLKKFLANNETPNSLFESTGLLYLDKQELTEKSISDVMEALIGVYLQNAGIKSTLSLLKYFGILPNDDFLTSVIPAAYSTPTDAGLIELLIPNYKKLEELLHYRFNDKNYLLQALTHSSFKSTVLTESYQKLEFIGDAVLDFLITSYIYQYSGNLSPGQLTDLRSALVNNNVFGALTVRLGLQKYMLIQSKRQEDAIDTFAIYQRNKQHKIYGNPMIIFKDNIPEEVDIPKVLGDIFESIVGAIFLDCHYDLEIVWRIYYNIMKDEIAKFSSGRIPINAVRALYENFVVNKFITLEDESKDNTQFTVKVVVIPKSKKIREFVGRGVNTVSAKRAAAKAALKNLGYPYFTI